MLKPWSAKTFEEYGANYSSKYKTTDIIFITSEGTNETKSKTGSKTKSDKQKQIIGKLATFPVTQ